MTNVTAVKDAYEAFAKGDAPAVLEFLDTNIAWTEADTTIHSWFKERYKPLARAKTTRKMKRCPQGKRVETDTKENAQIGDVNWTADPKR